MQRALFGPLRIKSGLPMFKFGAAAESATVLYPWHSTYVGYGLRRAVELLGIVNSSTAEHGGRFVPGTVKLPFRRCRSGANGGRGCKSGACIARPHAMRLKDEARKGDADVCVCDK